MIPKLVLLELPDDVKYLDDLLYTFKFPDSYLEKLMCNIVQTLRKKSEAYINLGEYVDDIRLKEGERVAKHVDKIGREIYHQLLDIKAYLPSGVTPYEYAGREENNYLILEFDEAFEVKAMGLR